MSQENEEVHVSVSLQYSENLVNSLKDPKRVKVHYAGRHLG